MRYLGLDLGSKRMGIALSDETLTIASSYKVINYKVQEEIIAELKEIIENFDISKIILGLPKNMNNTIGERAEETISFKELIENKLSISVELQDERLSTISAEKYMIEADVSRKKRKNKVDSLAATIILQTYLDKKGKSL